MNYAGQERQWCRWCRLGRPGARPHASPCDRENYKPISIARARFYQASPITSWKGGRRVKARFQLIITMCLKRENKWRNLKDLHGLQTDVTHNPSCLWAILLLALVDLTLLSYSWTDFRRVGCGLEIVAVDILPKVDALSGPEVASCNGRRNGDSDSFHGAKTN